MPHAEVGAKVAVLLEKNGNRVSVVGVYNSIGAAEGAMRERNALPGMAICWVEASRIVGT